MESGCSDPGAEGAAGAGWRRRGFRCPGTAAEWPPDGRPDLFYRSGSTGLKSGEAWAITPAFELECGRSSGVEHNLAKVRVDGSNPFARSNFPNKINILIKTRANAGLSFVHLQTC